MRTLAKAFMDGQIEVATTTSTVDAHKPQWLRHQQQRLRQQKQQQMHQQQLPLKINPERPRKRGPNPLSKRK